MVGRVGAEPDSDGVLKLYVVPLTSAAEVLRERDTPNAALAGVVSPRSVGPAHALNMTPFMVGVKSERVLCDSLSAARRSMFFCENTDGASTVVSRESSVILLVPSLPSPSTGSWGGLARGSVTVSFAFSDSARADASSWALCSGLKSFRDSL